MVEVRFQKVAESAGEYLLGGNKRFRAQNHLPIVTRVEQINKLDEPNVSSQIFLNPDIKGRALRKSLGYSVMLAGGLIVAGAMLAPVVFKLDEGLKSADVIVAVLGGTASVLGGMIGTANQDRAVEIR